MTNRPPISAFTLVELILVMALLATVMALSVPSLSRSMRQRNLDEEARRFLALTEYARDEAVSQGVPMSVWVNPTAQLFGVEPKPGFEGIESRNRQFQVNPDVQFGIEKGFLNGGVVRAIEFEPDGSPGPSSLDSVRLVDRFDSAISITRTTDRWSYEIVKETK
jgi:Prokaryotic N-terminal methylation motif